MSPDLILAVRLLRAGELVAFPTETVYGLGADAANPAAVAKVFAAKGRPPNHPLIVHLPGSGHLDQWAADIPQDAWDLAEALWPGPLTLILKRAPAVPRAVTGGQDTVGIRIPAHPLALELLRAYAQAGGGRNGMCGIAAPSANRFGRISPTDATHVRDELQDAVSMVLDGGPCNVGIESTIIDLSRDGMPPRLLRPGHITPEQIADIIGKLPELPETMKMPEAPRVPGSLDSHYAPRTPTYLVDTADLPREIEALQQENKRCGLLLRSIPPLPAIQSLCHLPDTPAGYARGLYGALRELDIAGNDIILVEAIPKDPAWAAIADRLRRASHGSSEKSTA